MPLFPWLKSSVAIGLDIADNKIRLVKLKRNKSTIKIEKYTSIDLPKAVIQDGLIKQSQEIIVQLKNKVTQWKIKNLSTAIALRSQCVVSKRLKLPVYLQKEDYETEIALHLNQYLPEMDEALYFDFIILGKPQEDYQEVLLFAARQSQIDSYVSVVNQTGLLVKIVDIDVYALVRAVQWSLDQDKVQWDCAGLLYFHEGFQFIIFNRREIIFAQSLLNDVSFMQQISATLQAQSLSIKQLDQCLVIGEISLEQTCFQDFQAVIPNTLRKIDIAHHINLTDLSENPANFLIGLGLALRGFKL